MKLILLFKLSLGFTKDRSEKNAKNFFVPFISS